MLDANPVIMNEFDFEKCFVLRKNLVSSYFHFHQADAQYYILSATS